MAAETTDGKDAIPARCPPSDRKMSDEDAVLIFITYLSE
jgi:hypothetical protein